MITRLASLKQALTALGDIDQEAGTLVPRATLPDLVAVGQRLWWIVKRANKALDVIKDRLRIEGGGFNTSRRFESGEGSHCMVLCPPQKMVLRKDADISRLRAVLGDKFSDFIEESVQYKLRKDFPKLVKDCTGDETKALLESVDMVSGTPRITFKD